MSGKTKSKRKKSVLSNKSFLYVESEVVWVFAAKFFSFPFNCFLTQLSSSINYQTLINVNHLIELNFKYLNCRRHLLSMIMNTEVHKFNLISHKNYSKQCAINDYVNLGKSERACYRPRKSL